MFGRDELYEVYSVWEYSNVGEVLMWMYKIFMEGLNVI